MKSKRLYKKLITNTHLNLPYQVETNFHQKKPIKYNFQKSQSMQNQTKTQKMTNLQIARYLCKIMRTMRKAKISSPLVQSLIIKSNPLNNLIMKIFQLFQEIKSKISFHYLPKFLMQLTAKTIFNLKKKVIITYFCPIRTSNQVTSAPIRRK